MTRSLHPLATESKTIAKTIGFYRDSPVSPLLEMISFKRPAYSKTEERFVRNYIDILPGAERDEYGNVIVKVGESPNILWSSHTDTVHHEQGTQSLFIDQEGLLRSRDTCLGGDCTVGIYLMIEMIKAGVPGLYIFHRDEEVGGGGSLFIAAETPERLYGIEFAIALDRKGKGDVITHQGQRCCSDVFARSLADILGGEYRPDDTGLFTDTANYTGLIGECTNISVGYFRQHSKHEAVDLDFVLGLRDILIDADWSGLVRQRLPGERETVVYPDAFAEWNWEASYPSNRKDVTVDVTEFSNRKDVTVDVTEYAYGGWDSDQIESFCQDHPAAVADFLINCGYTIKDLEDWSGFGPRDWK